MGRPERCSKLEGVGTQPTGTQPTVRDPRGARPRALVAWAPPAGIVAVAALAAVAVHGTVLVVAAVILLAVGTGLLGWYAGERRRRALQRQIDDRSSELHRALTELEIAQAETVRRLSMAVEFRDEDTGAHIERIGRFSTLLAEQLGARGRALPATQPRRPPPRRRQGRDPRRHPAQARPPHPRGALDRRDPRRGGPPPAARLLLLDPRHGRHDRPQPPREVGRQRLPARPRRRGHPDRGPHRRRRRRLRRAHQRPRLPRRLLRSSRPSR